MALKHYFAITPQNDNNKLVSSDMEQIEIPDYLIQYIGDSLQWIQSMWNGTVLNNGISYYGVSIIEGEEINKLLGILVQWKNLFELAPENFCITGMFMPKENQHEKIFVNRNSELYILNSWIHICKTALVQNARILHNGI